MIEPDGQRIVLADQRRAQLVICKTLAPQDGRVLQGFKELCFPLCGALDSATFLVGGASADRVNTHAAVYIWEPGVCCLPVLIARTCADQLVQNIVADLAMPLRWTDTGLLHSQADQPGGRPVTDAFGLRIEPRAGAAFDGSYDAWPRRTVTSCSRSRKQTRYRAVSCNAQRKSGAEQNTTAAMKGSCPCFLHALCRWSSVRSFLALVLAAMTGLSVVTSRPSVSQVHVPASPHNPAWAALDFDEEAALRCADEQINFVAAAVGGDELEVRPGPIGLMVGEALVHELQRITLPGIL